MNSISLYSEPFAATGNIAGEGFRNLLGRPSLNLLQTVIRESIQNSVDAASTGKQLLIRIRYRELTVSQRKFLQKTLFAQLPLSKMSSEHLRTSLEKETLRVLEICDFGTSGLGGPTRADLSPGKDESPDFVNFIRNVGAKRDTHQGGGTYGYGKTSYYAISAASTILVDSMTARSNSGERRFIGCHLGEAFDVSDECGISRRYTGRHWWGVLDAGDGVEPLRDENASAVADSIGILPRNIDEHGTSVLILDPQFGSDSVTEARDDLIEAVLWNFWPRMTESTPLERRLQVKLEIDGENVPIPSPEDFPPLDLYSKALGAIREGHERVETIQCRMPKKDLGKLFIQKGMRAERTGPAVRPVEETMIPRNSHGIALMRPVELVVKYLEGDPFPDNRFEWAGVFICSSEDEVESAFASSEPPAHDDWCPNNLPKGHGKTFVNVGLRELKKLANSFANPGAGIKAGNADGTSLAATASKIGTFLNQSSGQGPGKTPAGQGGGGNVGRPGKTIKPYFERLETSGSGELVSVFKADLPTGQADSVVAEPFLVLDGGKTGNEDLPQELSTGVHSIELTGTARRTDQHELRVECDGGTLEIRLRMPPDAAVGLNLRLVKGGDE